jgi:CubicO group peptidase (beta-lactamase class C family)
MREGIERQGIVVLLLLLGVIGCGSEPAPQPETTVDPVAMRLDSYLDRMVPFGFSGTVLLARNGEVLLESGYGWADEARGLPNAPETRFPIESISKQFTAATLLHLEMEGKVDLSASIAEYLPGVVPEDKTGITPHHLLSHTSGIITGTEDYFEDNGRDAIVATALSSPLLFEPGERDAYSNIGYALLAAIVEHVTGEDFRSYQQRTIFAPADLHQTGYPNASADPASVARRYLDGVDNGSPLDDSDVDWNHQGAGGVLSTTGDLLRWHQALEGTDVLSEEAKAKMYTPVANGYGYGWYISDTDNGQLLEHDGGSSRGSGGDFARYTDEGVTLIVLSNRDAEFMLFGARLMGGITRIAFGDHLDLPPVAPVAAPGTTLEEYGGPYRFADGSSIEVSASGSLLELRGIGQRAIEGLLGFTEIEASAHAEMNDRTAELLSALVEGNASPVTAASSATLGPRLKEMFEGIAESDGNPLSYQVAGTVPASGVRGAEHMTLLTLTYPSRQRGYRFYWGNGKILALGGGSLKEPVRIRAVPGQGDEFLGYHVATARASNFRFERDSLGQVSQLLFDSRVGHATKGAGEGPPGAR